MREEEQQLKINSSSQRRKAATAEERKPLRQLGHASQPVPRRPIAADFFTMGPRQKALLAGNSARHTESAWLEVFAGFLVHETEAGLTFISPQSSFNVGQGMGLGYPRGPLSLGLGKS